MDIIKNYEKKFKEWNKINSIGNETERKIMIFYNSLIEFMISFSILLYFLFLILFHFVFLNCTSCVLFFKNPSFLISSYVCKVIAY